MPQRWKVEIQYREERVTGEWWVADGQVWVTSSLGRMNQSVRGGMPSEIAQVMLRELARKADPTRKRFFFF